MNYILRPERLNNKRDTEKQGSLWDVEYRYKVLFTLSNCQVCLTIWGHRLFPGMQSQRKLDAVHVFVTVAILKCRAEFSLQT